MIESSDRLAWRQYREGGTGMGNGLQAFNDKQPDKRLPLVKGFFDDINTYANVDDLMGVPSG
jgi:hypothetical protein